jgi:hypothetical protein
LVPGLELGRDELGVVDHAVVVDVVGFEYGVDEGGELAAASGNFFLRHL